MYLVDTSVWIDFFRQINNPATELFTFILKKNLPFGITGIIYQEILQGAATEANFNQLQKYLITQRFFPPRHETSTYELAAKLFYKCRRKGIAVRSSIDCLIAQIAMEYKMTLLHNDQDYNRIQSLIPELDLATT